MTTQVHPARRTSTASPVLFGLAGAAVSAGLTAYGTFKEHLLPGDTAGWLFINLPIIAVATAVIFGVVVRYALHDTSGARAARTALILSLAGVATTVVFYLGLNAVLAAAATCCALAARRHTGRLNGVAAVALALSAAAVGLAIALAIYG
jgi:hypothetical protein